MRSASRSPQRVRRRRRRRWLPDFRSARSSRSRPRFEKLAVVAEDAELEDAQPVHRRVRRAVQPQLRRAHAVGQRHRLLPRDEGIKVGHLGGRHRDEAGERRRRRERVKRRRRRHGRRVSGGLRRRGHRQRAAEDEREHDAGGDEARAHDDHTTQRHERPPRRRRRRPRGGRARVGVPRGGRRGRAAGERDRRRPRLDAGLFADLGRRRLGPDGRRCADGARRRLHRLWEGALAHAKVVVGRRAPLAKRCGQAAAARAPTTPDGLRRNNARGAVWLEVRPSVRCCFSVVASRLLVLRRAGLAVPVVGGARLIDGGVPGHVLQPRIARRGALAVSQLGLACSHLILRELTSRDRAPGRRATQPASTAVLCRLAHCGRSSVQN